MTTKESNLFSTTIVCLKDLHSYQCSIPTYQRPYVWGDEQLKKLLDDIKVSFDESNATHNADLAYYLGNILTKKTSESIELIDGQQRFTSLWLIAFSISKKSKSKLTDFLMLDGKLRLSFEIRDEVKEYLESLLTESNKYDEQFIQGHPYLKRIAKALTFINGYIETISKEDIERFGNYIYSNVKMIENDTPLNTDLNKLFATMNSAGVQLEQTDIVKANLLGHLKTSDGTCGTELVLFAKLWESCEDMNNFFEYSIRKSFAKAKNVDFLKEIDLTLFIDFPDFMSRYSTDENTSDQGTNLFCIDDLDIEKNDLSETKNEEEKDSEIDNEDNLHCRSIISFAQLLIHTYRIYLSRKKETDFKGVFQVNRLIDIFKELKVPEEIKEFLYLLWKVRYHFDKHIIKWMFDFETQRDYLQLVTVNKNDNSYYTTIFPKSELLMLQSILYFTGDYLRQYWLTSYLGYLVKDYSNEKDDISHLAYLEYIDNTFSLNSVFSNKDLSRKLLDNLVIAIDKDIEKVLKKPSGTAFEHYWFYKLEYILWKEWHASPSKSTGNGDKFTSYRISSKNSVEHIYPQHPENKIDHPLLEDNNILNSFGNLVLLSVSQNSEYSNKSVEIKKAMFNDTSRSLDSFKSSYIFGYDKWTEIEIQDHCNKMIQIIKTYYDNTSHSHGK